MAGPPRRPRVAPRKRPAQARSGVLVEAILEAAARLLDGGPAGYTTNTIAERAGVSIGSLYQYFPSKDAITLALVERAAARLVADIEQAALLADWRAALGAMVRAAVRHQLEQPRLASALDAQEARLAALRVDLPDPARIASALAAVLARAPGAGDRSDALADLIAITRALCDAAGTRGDTDVAALERRVERAVFGYLDWSGHPGPRGECE